MPKARPYTLNDAQHHFLLSWMWRRVTNPPRLQLHSEARTRRIAFLLMCFLLSAGFELGPGGVADCGLYGGVDYCFLGLVDACGTVGNLGGI